MGRKSIHVCVSELLSGRYHRELHLWDALAILAEIFEIKD